VKRRKLYRTIGAGRLHHRNRCTGGATPSTTRVVHLTDEEFDQYVAADKVCKCVPREKKR
jgi:hypothetical protein